MNRLTEYHEGYGYITKYQDGNGIFETVGSFFKDLITSDAAKKAASEAATSFAKTAGTKAGEKLVNKVFNDKKKTVEKVEKLIETPKVEFTYLAEPKNTVKNEIKPSTKSKVKKQTQDLLKELYGDGLFRTQKGGGIKRI